MGQIIVVKLGGSLLSHSDAELFDFKYLQKLKSVLTLQELNDFKFFLAIGGGYTMRKYRDLAKEAGVTSDMELHWIGTTVNVLNAFLVKAYFEDIADSEVIKYEDYYEDEKLNTSSKVQIGGGSSVIDETIEDKFDIAKKIKVGGGGRPGHSGDMDALLAAQKLGANTVVSLKKVDGIYDSDPTKNPTAKKISRLTWDEYFEIIDNKTSHEPGGNYPIDPVTGRMAKEIGAKFVVIDGHDLESFKNFLLGKEFSGSIVS